MLRFNALVGVSCLLSLGFVLHAAVWADPVAETATLSDEDVQRLIEQFESSDFAERQAASRRLFLAGRAVVEPLAKAAESPQRETMARTIELLQQFAASDDAETKAAARAALEQVARGSNERAATRAKAILDPPTPKQPPMPAGGGIIIGPQGIQGGGRIVIGGGGGIRIGGGQVQIGERGQIITTQVNGANRTVKVVRGNGQQIVIEDTEQSVKITVVDVAPNGKPAERSAEAKDAAALKEKNAELHEIYQQYDGYRKSGVTIKGG